MQMINDNCKNYHYILNNSIYSKLSHNNNKFNQWSNKFYKWRSI
jgi:hypothetical protein